MREHIEQRNPKELRPHELIANLPRWEKGSADFVTLCDSLRVSGVIEPLTITQDGRVMNGETRRQAAVAVELAFVPCLVRDEKDAWQICLETELRRRHLTKGQIAFKFWPVVAEEFEAAKAARAAVATVAKTPFSINALSARMDAKRVAEVAKQIGVSLRILQQAQQIHDFFRDETKRVWSSATAQYVLKTLGRKRTDKLTFREYFEPQIMAPDEDLRMSLGGCLSGIQFVLDLEMQERETGRPHQHPGGKPEKQNRQMELFNEVWKDLRTRFEYWPKLSEALKEKALAEFEPTLEAMPDDLLSTLERRVAAERRRRMKAK